MKPLMPKPRTKRSGEPPAVPGGELERALLAETSKWLLRAWMGLPGC